MCLGMYLCVALCRVCALSPASLGVQEGPRFQEEHDPRDWQQSQVRGPLATGLSPCQKTWILTWCYHRAEKQEVNGFPVCFLCHFQRQHCMIVAFFVLCMTWHCILKDQSYAVQYFTIYQWCFVAQVLIFPEGTCTNRSCLITFKQGKIQNGILIKCYISQSQTRKKDEKRYKRTTVDWQFHILHKAFLLFSLKSNPLSRKAAQQKLHLILPWSIHYLHQGYVWRGSCFWLCVFVHS